jgi:DNA mismatch endonuclease, patch repair protein
MDRALKDALPHGQFHQVPAQRSRTMGAVKGKGNVTTELRLKMALVRSGVSGFSLHANSLPGRPDFLFLRAKLAVFVDGCFWHGCKKCFHKVRSNTLYWSTKVKLNRERDSRTSKQLKKIGYQVLRIWEHDLAEDLNGAVLRIKEHIKAESIHLNNRVAM